MASASLALCAALALATAGIAFTFVATTPAAACVTWDSFQEKTCVGTGCTGSWNPGTNQCHGVAIIR